MIVCSSLVGSLVVVHSCDQQSVRRSQIGQRVRAAGAMPGKREERRLAASAWPPQQQRPPQQQQHGCDAGDHGVWRVRKIGSARRGENAPPGRRAVGRTRHPRRAAGAARAVRACARTREWTGAARRTAVVMLGFAIFSQFDFACKGAKKASPSRLTAGRTQEARNLKVPRAKFKFKFPTHNRVG